MIAYLKRAGIYMLAMTIAVVVILAIIGGFILWVRLGEWLIPVDISYRLLKQIAYVVISVIIVGSLLFALGGDE